MNKKIRIVLGAMASVVLLLVVLWYGVLTSSASREAGAMVRELAAVAMDPGAAREEVPVLRGTFRLAEGEGIPKELVGHSARIAYQAPDRLRIGTEIGEKSFSAGRNGDEVWMHAPHRDFAIVGTNEVPRFAADPESVLPVQLAPLILPVKSWKLALLPVLIEVEKTGDTERNWTPKGWAAGLFDLPDFNLALQLDVRGWPEEVTFSRDDVRVTLVVEDLEVEREPSPNGSDTAGDAWDLGEVGEGTVVERVALSHLQRFAGVIQKKLTAKIPELPPLSGERTLLATHGKGRLESIEGTRVLFLEGTPEEMGEQHGTLLREEVGDLLGRILYGVGVGSSLDKGRWFFGEIEEAQARLNPFIDERYLREMDAMAAAAGIHPQEARLGNFFPELFHCSGFALHGSATADGQLYHGRILDYLRGLGLEENATLMVVKPDRGHAWVNVSYAGFIGTVTAMNEKQIAIGEMGGRGEGDWDGKPMAQLMREVMERAGTLEEAVAIMREAPRTCEYYYVISDAKSDRAVGIKATPEIFETIWSGEEHPQLPDPVEDAVLMSAGDRYRELVRRVKGGWGEFDAESARELMTRPVCMTSNIQSVLFAPGSLDFWVANADSGNVASHCRYTKYNLRELLGKEREKLVLGE